MELTKIDREIIRLFHCLSKKQKAAYLNRLRNNISNKGNP